MIRDQCLGSGTSVGDSGGGRSRGREVTCPVCGRGDVKVRPGRNGRLYQHGTEPRRKRKATQVETSDPGDIRKGLE